MAEDDARTRSKGPNGGVSHAPLATGGAKAKKGLVLAPSEPDLDASRPSMTSVDDLLGAVEAAVGEALPVDEEHKPFKLQRGAMHRSAVPPPLPRKPAPPDRARHPSSRPPLPAPLPPPMPPPMAPSSGARGPNKPSSPPRPRPGGTVPPPLPRSAARGPAFDLLHARIASLEAEGNVAALGRALSELAVMHELLEDEALAIATARAALARDPELAAMHALLRRKEHPTATPSALRAHLEEELKQASEGPLRVSLLAERARLLTAEGRNDDALAAWSEVLANEPMHAGALRAKEAALASAQTAEPAMWVVEAAHLGAMAEAYADDPATAAWLEVERAAILELRLGDVDGARRALTNALGLQPGVGPARRALVRHVTRRRDAAALFDLLDEEGEIETDPSRAARLELEAACVAEGAMRDPARGIRLLERAASRAPTTPSVDLRVADDLTRLLDATGRTADAARWRRGRLALVSGAEARAEELRSLARAAERVGDVDAAISDLKESLAELPDAATVAHLDRLLANAGRHEPRVALWVTDAARTPDPAKRVAGLLRAALIAERALGRTDDAIRHLRTAWATVPGHPEVLEAMTRLLSRPAKDAGARSRLELYAHAAHVAPNLDQKIVYLERVALIAEETLADFARASSAYEAILALDASHRGALLGLARTAARMGDDPALHRALLAEARASRSETEALSLRIRAAAAIAETDAAAARALVHETLEADPTHRAALALATRLYEAGGQWELVARSMAAELTHAAPDERRSLLLSLAEVQAARLKAPRDALLTLLRAREAFPGDATVLASIARALEAVDDPAALREAYLSLANTATADTERAQYLVRAAELSEHRLGDDAAALRAYEDALIATPDDALVNDRLERARARCGHATPTDPLDHALELVIKWEDPTRAVALAESELARGADPVPPLRLLERLHRATKSWSALASVLTQQADALRSPRPKLGALSVLAELEEWKLAAKPGRSTYARVLAVDPLDEAALEATVRIRLPSALAGDLDARREVIDAFRKHTVLETGTAAAMTELCLAHLLDRDDAAEGEAIEALEHYRRVLAIDPCSVMAAWGMRRLAHRLGHWAAAVEASTILGELTLDPKARGRHFFDAAEMLTNVDGPAIGRDRAERAAALLERALAADPDSVASATALVARRAGLEQSDAIVRALEAALERARETNSIIYLGTELARVAREDLHDLGVATVAMQRVRDVAPDHAPTLLTLAELYLAQRAWPEAVVTLESVVQHTKEAEPRLTALFALASVYEKILARPDEHERVLRAALAIEPTNPRALRSLIDQLRHARAASSRPSPDATPELARLLFRLAAAETEPSRKCEVYLEVADLETEAGDLAAAERSLVAAIVGCPDNARAFARLAAFFRRGGRLDVPAYARALQDLIARGREAGHADARWFAALGQLEVDNLKRLNDGVAHLEWAVQLDPTLHETRFELADAYAKTGAKALAIRSLLSLLGPDARALTTLADAGVALALLERLLEAEKRSEEAVVVSELRATFGELEPSRDAWLRARKLAEFEEHNSPLGRAALTDEVLPKAGRHVLLDVAAAGSGLEAKLLRANLADFAVHSRDRIGPRSTHPLRPVFDRATAALGVGEIELAVSAVVDRVRVVSQDGPWVLVPPTLEEQPEGVQVAALARACARIVLGVPWLKELRDSAILGWLVALARQVVPAYGLDEGDAQTPDVLSYEPLVARNIGRKQRKLLDGLAAHLQMREGRPPDRTTFVRALDQCTARAAYVVSGDLLAVALALALEDASLREALARPGLPALEALLSHPLAGDVARFALTPEATALRQRVGATWAR